MRKKNGVCSVLCCTDAPSKHLRDCRQIGLHSTLLIAVTRSEFYSKSIPVSVLKFLAPIPCELCVTRFNYVIN